MKEGVEREENVLEVVIVEDNVLEGEIAEDIVEEYVDKGVAPNV